MGQMLRLAVPLLLLLTLIGVSVLTDRPLPRADFTFINRGDVSTMDPQRMSWQQELRIARLVFEGLVRNDVFDPDYRIIPAAAESWDLSDDRRTYTFHLRHNARWSDGRPVTAQDFIFSWRRAMLPDNASDYTAQFLLIKGARDFYTRRAADLSAFRDDKSIPDRPAAARALWEAGLARFDELVALRAIDDRTLRVELERPIPYFLELCALAVFYPVHPPLIEAHQRLNPDTGLMETDAAWTKPPTLIGNGPFNLTRWRFKRDMRFEKSPTYWNAASIAIDSIAIPAITDPTAQAMAQRTGGVMWVSDVVARFNGEMVREKSDFEREHSDEIARWRAEGIDAFEIARRLPRDPRNDIHAVPAFGTYFYNFNCAPTLPDGRANPFHDPRIRRAFALAIDKRAITEQIRRIGEPTSTTLIPPGSIGGYPSPPGLASDPEMARALLAESGYPGGRGFITVEILYNADGGHDLIAQSVARDWQQELGVQVVLAQKELKVFREDLKTHNFIVSKGAWFGDYGDPVTFLDINRTADGNNDRVYSNPEYDALLDRARDELDPAARLSLLSRAEGLMLRDACLVPLFQYANVYQFDAHQFTGLSPHPRGDQCIYLIDVFGDGKGTDQPKVMRSAGPTAR
ncbi:MAG: peptide ABC transporter substrate-binding protein [Phycisphaerales bacterium]|nr:peptide ABC transporter substrate-binding protein [Phycisphaerales bacterium]